MSRCESDKEGRERMYVWKRARTHTRTHTHTRAHKHTRTHTHSHQSPERDDVSVVKVALLLEDIRFRLPLPHEQLPEARAAWGNQAAGGEA